MAEPVSPVSTMDGPFSLMYTFDGYDGEELVLGVCREGALPKPHAPSAAAAIHMASACWPPKPYAASPAVDVAPTCCHRYQPLDAVLGRPDSGVLSQLIELGAREAAPAKATQLLMQWLALPTSETMLQLVLSNARRGLPIARDLAIERSGRDGGRSSLPVAPAPVRQRWSVSGGTPRHHRPADSVRPPPPRTQWRPTGR